MRKTASILLMIMLLFLFCHPAQAEAIENFDELLPPIDPYSSLSPVKNLRFETHYAQNGERSLRILWDSVKNADAYYVLYSFSEQGVNYPNSRLLNAEQLYYEPNILGCGLHTFRVYPMLDNQTCKDFADLEIFVANSSFFPSMLSDGQQIDYYSSATVELGLSRFRELAESNALSEKTPLQKIHAIHRIICDAIEYSTEESDAYKAILSGRGLCDAYARGFKILCDLSGVPCKYIIGRAGENGIDYESHAWNMVELDGKYYHIDATWDDIEGSFHYFLIPDHEIERTHTVGTQDIPIADSERFMLNRGTFSASRLRMSCGETETINLKLFPQESAFRAELRLSDPNVAEYTLDGDSLSITALDDGSTSIELFDGSKILDTLQIDVIESYTDTDSKDRQSRNEHNYLMWISFIFIVIISGLIFYRQHRT